MSAPGPDEPQNGIQRTARLAGALYLLNAVLGFFAIMYVPGKVMVSGNAAATADAVLAHETLLRVGIVAELASAVEFIFLVRALDRLLGHVDRSLAKLMLTLALIAVPIGVVNALNPIAALTVLKGVHPGAGRPDALAMLFLRLHGEGFGVASIFWGLWLLPLAVLVVRSGFLPRLLGVLLILAGVSYLGDGVVGWLLPGGVKAVSRVALALEALGELSTMLWLLVVGAARPRGSAAPTGSPA